MVLSWEDPRVREALTFAKAIIDAGGFPSSFSSLKLGEAHGYFHTKPGAVTFQMGSFYPSRAFQPADQGGQPAGFELGSRQRPDSGGGGLSALQDHRGRRFLRRQCRIGQCRVGGSLPQLHGDTGDGQQMA